MPRTIGPPNEIPARGRRMCGPPRIRPYGNSGGGTVRCRSCRERMCNGTSSVRVAQHNMGVIRHVVLNLLKCESTKISVRKKRIRAVLNYTFREDIDGITILYSVTLQSLREVRILRWEEKGEPHIMAAPNARKLETGRQELQRKTRCGKIWRDTRRSSAT